MRIYTCDEPELSVKCAPVDTEDVKVVSSLLSQASKMADTMYANAGCGIAHPQVGGTERLIVVDCSWDPKDDKSRNPIVMFNPEITWKSAESISGAEGCLSVPGVDVFLSRAAKVRVRYIDEYGREQEIEADDLFSRCLQHEIDHLDGITTIDHLSGAKKLQAIAFLASAKKLGVKSGQRSPYVIR